VFYFLFSTGFPAVKKAQEGGADFLGGRRLLLLGAVGNAMARDHVLHLSARQPVRRQNDQADEAVTLSSEPLARHSGRSREASRTLENIYSAPHSSGSRCGRDPGWVRKKDDVTRPLAVLSGASWRAFFLR